MPDYLLALSIGPVQDFIAAARRTRDLWYGSTLLSNLSQKVALTLEAGGAKLIFPNVDLKDKKNKQVNVANQIVASINADNIENVREIAEAAKEAARAYWNEQANKAFKDSRLDMLINSKILESQINDVLELYAVWVCYPSEGNNTYKKARQRLMALLSARKNTRDFGPGKGFEGVRKSLLDGARESVLPEGELCSEQIKACRQLGIKVTGEEEKKRCEPLDIAGVVKRVLPVLNDEGHYPSVARIAVDPWIRRMNTSSLFGEQDIPKNSQGKLVVSKINTENFLQYKEFPYDGTILFTDRYPSIAKEEDIDEKEFDTLREQLKDLYEKYGKPSPYLAVLCADGDRIGLALEAVESLEKHQAFSQVLSTFAKEARDMVEKEHQGVCVYSGGDDVLAFLPLGRCLKAAGELRKKFGECLSGFKDDKGKDITLSVGIAIGHFMEEMSQLRRWGKEAEKKAKENGRDSLAIALHMRNGGTLELQAAWSSEPDKQLQQWIKVFQDDLPRTLPYELHQLLSLYEHHVDPFIADVRRLLKVKDVKNALLLNEINQGATYNNFKKLNEMLLLASRLSSHIPIPEEMRS